MVDRFDNEIPKDWDEEITVRYKLGLKRMALVSSLIAFITAIPVLIFMPYNSEYSVLWIYGWMVVLIGGLRTTPWIIKKIWK